MPPRADAPSLALTQAADPHTSPDELTRLAAHESREVCLAVIANPATPRSVVDATLAKYLPANEAQGVVDAVMGNASLPLWLLEDPGWMSRQPWSTALMMARSPALSAAGWEALVGHASDHMNAALLSSPVAPPEAWRRCGFSSELDGLRERLDGAEDADEEAALVASFVAHPELSPRLRDEPDWLRRGAPRAARALASSSSLTRALWEALRGHPDERTRLALLRSPLAPDDAWTSLGLPSTGAWDLSEEGLGSDDLIDLAQRPQLAGLTALSVYSEDQPALAALVRSPFLSGLTSLALPQFSMTSDALHALSEAAFRERISALDLSYNHLDELPPDALTGLGSLDALASLDLSHNELTDDHLEAVLGPGTLGSLTALDLSSNELSSSCMETLYTWAAHARPSTLALAENILGDAAVEALARSASFATLTSLDLGSTDMTHDGAEALARSTTLTALTSLTLRNDALGDRAVMAMARSAALSRLTHLSLSHTHLGPPSGAAIAGSTTLLRLASLDLSGNPLGDDGVSALCWSAFLTGLRSLQLGHTDVGAAGVKALSEASMLAGLTSLDLSSNRGVDDACMAILGRARSLREVTSLVLSGTSVGDDGLEALARSDALPQLAHMDLAYLSVTTRGLLALTRSASLPRLRELDFHSCDMSEEGIAVLARASFHRVVDPWPSQLFRRELPRVLSATARARRRAGSRHVRQKTPPHAPHAGRRHVRSPLTS